MPLLNHKMDRPSKSLIDTRGRQSLMQTPHQRRDSVQTSSRGRNTRSQTPEPPPKTRRPNVDLGAMLKPSHLPPEKYYAIQSALLEQDEMIADRGHEIRDRCTQISYLHRELKEANARIERDRERLTKHSCTIAGLEKQLTQAKKEKDSAAEELRSRKRYFEEMNDDQEDLINVGRKILSEKNAETGRLGLENKKLRTAMSDRDATISSLNEQILRITSGPGNEMAAIAVEEQAQRTLGMVRGLQNDLAERDRTINEMRADNEALATANASCQSENMELKMKNKELEARIKAVEKRATESKEILEEQNCLIDRLMRGNAAFLKAGSGQKK